MINAILGFMFVALCILYGWSLIDTVITKKRLKENQKAWDEYSKGMTEYEKLEIYNDWCRQRKLEKGWEYFYFPRM